MTEFARPTPLDRIGAQGAVIAVAARPDELRALATRMQVPAVARLACRFTLRRAGPSVIEATGELDAEVTQVCVLSLEEFSQPVRESFAVQFVAAGTETSDPDPQSPDQVPYTGHKIDLGEAAAEQLALALDPYPHMPGAATAAEADAAGGGGMAEP